jgi:hypothetical protein
MSPRAALEPLASAFAFDKGAPTRLVRAQETELPNDISLGFTDAGLDYRRAAVTSRRLVGGSAKTAHADLASVMDRVAAERRANIWLQDLWAGREQASFALPPSRLKLAPGDVIALTIGDRRRLFEIREAVDSSMREINARSIDPEVFAVPLAQPRPKPPELPSAVGPAEVVLLDLPMLPADATPVLLRAAIVASPWPGPVAVWRSFDGLSFERIAIAMAPATAGETLDPVPAGPRDGSTCATHSGSVFTAACLPPSATRRFWRRRMRPLWCSRMAAWR